MASGDEGSTADRKQKQALPDLDGGPSGLPDQLLPVWTDVQVDGLTDRKLPELDEGAFVVGVLWDADVVAVRFEQDCRVRFVVGFDRKQARVLANALFDAARNLEAGEAPRDVQAGEVQP